MSFGIYDLYRLLQPRFRADRIRLFLETFRPGPQTTILDVGGYLGNWEHIPITSKITLLNLEPIDPARKVPERFTLVRGDGRALPFEDQSFDIVCANSVIEHLYTEQDQRLFASEAMRVGRSVFIQTPNRWFPIEPHFLSLFVHFLPQRVYQRWLPRFCLRRFLSLGEHANLRELAREIRLVSENDLSAFFPGAVIQKEKIFGLCKSLLVIKCSRSDKH